MLSSRGRYAIKAMLHLARAEPGALCKAGDIACEEKIAYKFLTVILATLKAHGLVESIRGRDGGYRLAYRADAISLRDIVVVTEGALVPTTCAHLGRGHQRCRDCADAPCGLQPIMITLLEQVYDMLGNITLAAPGAERFGAATADHREAELA